MPKTVLTAEEAENYITNIGPSLGSGDFTHSAVFPKKRKDVCAIRRMAENGRTYGFDTIYLVWKDKDGQIQHRELINSKSTKDYIHIIIVEADGNAITVEYGSGGSYSGKRWEDSSRITI